MDDTRFRSHNKKDPAEKSTYTEDDMQTKNRRRLEAVAGQWLCVRTNH